MKISAEGLALVKEHEGVRLHAYLDSVNVPTIGYGHTAAVKMGDSCTQEQADAWLQQDIAVAERCVANSVTVPVTQSQYDALCSFVFNLGCASLRNSTLLRKLNAGDDAGAAEEFNKWIHAGGKVLAGLVTRREAEKQLFLA